MRGRLLLLRPQRARAAAVPGEPAAAEPSRLQEHGLLPRRRVLPLRQEELPLQGPDSVEKITGLSFGPEKKQLEILF